MWRNFYNKKYDFDESQDKLSKTAINKLNRKKNWSQDKKMIFLNFKFEKSNLDNVEDL